jgi:hypothetical protein
MSAATLLNRQSPFAIRGDGQVPLAREQHRRIEAIAAAEGATADKRAGNGLESTICVEKLRPLGAPRTGNATCKRLDDFHRGKSQPGWMAKVDALPPLAV